MARFKSEFLSSYWTRHGTPLAARVLGHVHEMAHWGSRFAPLSNWVAQSAPARWLNERLVGVDRRRTPPTWVRDTFAAQFARRTRHPARGSSGPAALIFNDTFTNFYHPEIGIAGAGVLEAAGFDIQLAPNHCCGRPLISQGLLEEARARAQANADRLYPLVAGGASLVFFEPSCLSAVKEDAPSLLRGEAQKKATLVAEACVLFEDVLERAWQTGPPNILIHGHCHQKSMGLLAPAKALLSRIPGSVVVDLEAGCCGMAGSFGYMRAHFDISRNIGERRLLPAARSAGADTVLVAAGVSCRHQVHDFAGVRALHPAELLRSLCVQRGAK
jgi:Fe-S oxidoreductase